MKGRTARRPIIPPASCEFAGGRAGYLPDISTAFSVAHPSTPEILLGGCFAATAVAAQAAAGGGGGDCAPCGGGATAGSMMHRSARRASGRTGKARGGLGAARAWLLRLGRREPLSYSGNVHRDAAEIVKVRPDCSAASTGQLCRRRCCAAAAALPPLQSRRTPAVLGAAQNEPNSVQQHL